MPLTRIWKLYEHWKVQPPTHVLLAMFLEYGGEGSERRPIASKAPGFDFGPSTLAAFGTPVPVEQLHPAIRKSVGELHADPRYHEFRKKIEAMRNGG